MRKVLLAILILALLLPLAAVQADEHPTIAILSFGELPTNAVTEGAVLDVLESYGFIKG